MTKVLMLSASTMGSKSRALVEVVKPLLNEAYDVSVFDLKEHQMDFADGRDYRDYTGSTKKLIELILGTDVIVISTPVYQASIPGSLKNIFDLLPIDSLKDKVIGMVVSAGSEKHFLVPEYQLKPILKYMKADVIESYVFVTGEDMLDQKVISDHINLRIEQLVTTLDTHVEQARIKKEQEDLLYDF